jgi:hypothetical protein
MRGHFPDRFLHRFRREWIGVFGSKLFVFAVKLGVFV